MVNLLKRQMRSFMTHLPFTSLFVIAAINFLCPTLLHAFLPIPSLDALHPMVVPTEKQPSEEQLAYLDLLNAPQREGEESFVNYEVLWSSSSGNPLTIRLLQPFPIQGSYEATARNCLQAFAGLYRFTDPNQRFQDLKLTSIQEIPRPLNGDPAKEYQ